MPHARTSLDELGEGVFRKVRRALGVTAFGVNGIVLPPGAEWFNHFHEQQDELYFVHAGRVGAGTRMKLARNLIHFVAFTAVTEAQRLAEAADLDLVALGEVVRHTDAITGGPGAIMHRDTTAPLDPDDFWWGVLDHVRALGEKDLSFAIELAGTLGVDVPLAQLARERLAKGLGL